MTELRVAGTIARVTSALMTLVALAIAGAGAAAFAGAEGASLWISLGLGSAAGIVLATWRSSAVALIISVDRIEIRNFFQHFILRWPEIEAIGWDRFQLNGEGGAPTVAVRLGNGKMLTAQAAWGLFAAEREQVVATLQALAKSNGVAHYLAAEDLVISIPETHPNQPLGKIAREPYLTPLA